MRKKNLLVPVLAMLFVNTFSQREIVIKAEKSTYDESISLIAQNNSLNTYTVCLNFPGLEGYSNSLAGNRNIAIVYPGANNIAKLQKIKGSNVYSYQYKYNYFIGRALRDVPDTGFVYLLPAANGNFLQASDNVTSLEERLGQKAPAGFHNYIFKFRLGDTICAARGGIIYNMAVEMKEGEKHNQTYTASRDRISIEQKDGTLAHYAFTAPISMLVGEGDKVIAGQPIAVFSTPSDKLHLLFSVTYLSDKKLNDYLLSERDEEKRKDIYQHLPVNFCLHENNNGFIKGPGDFKVFHPINIITQEMSRKELKKFNH
jgi:hypothetical protein